MKKFCEWQKYWGRYRGTFGRNTLSGRITGKNTEGLWKTIFVLPGIPMVLILWAKDDQILRENKYNTV